MCGDEEVLFGGAVIFFDAKEMFFDAAVLL
jgi:hypothetical protein